MPWPSGIYPWDDIRMIQYMQINKCNISQQWAFQVALVVKNLPANAGDTRDSGSIPGLGRSLGGGQGNLHQYSLLENHMDGGAWRATVRSVAQTWRKQLNHHHHHHHINKMNNNNHMIISIDAERVFDRILFMVEILNRVGIVGIYLNVIKGV